MSNLTFQSSSKGVHNRDSSTDSTGTSCIKLQDHNTLKRQSHYLKAFFQMFSVFLQYYLCIDCLINVVSLQRSQAIQKYGSSHVLLKPIRDTWNRPHHVYITIHIKNALEYLQQAYTHCQKCQHYWDLIAKTFNVNKRHYLGWVVLTTNTGIKK